MDYFLFDLEEYYKILFYILAGAVILYFIFRVGFRFRVIQILLKYVRSMNQILIGMNKVLAIIIGFYVMISILASTALMGVKGISILYLKVSLFSWINGSLAFFAIGLGCATMTLMFYLLENVHPKMVSLDYEKGGRFRNWSKATEQYLAKINWAERVFRNLEEARCFGSGRIVIWSPSANCATYELKLSRFLQSSGHPVICFASDQLSGKEQPGPIEEETLIFRYKGSINADLALDWLKEEGYPKVDVIWDIKGVLRYKPQKEVANQLLHYAESLQVGGCVVIEAYSRKNSLASWLNSIHFELKGRSFDYLEKSTYQSKMMEAYKKDGRLKEVFDEVHVVDPEQPDCNMVVYMKKQGANQ